MFCNKCGRPIDDDRLLCEQCASENEVAEVDAAEVSSEVFTLNTSGEVSSKKPGKGLLIGAIIAGVAIVALVIALLWGPISGLLGFGLKFDTPQEHFYYVEGKAVDQLTDGITAAYGNYLARAEQTEGAYETEVHVLVGEELLDLLAAYLGTGDELDLSWLSDIMLKIDSTANTEMAQGLISLGLGDSEVVSADVIVDISEMVVWLAIPELSSTYMQADLQEMMDGSSVEPNAAFSADMLPSEQVINRHLEKYTDIIISGISNVQSVKETVTVGDVSQECTVLTATVDEKALIEITVDVLEAARDDEELSGVLENIVRISAPEQAETFAADWKSEINEALEEVRGSLEEASADNYVQWIDYVDDKNHIIGRRISVSDLQEEIYYLTASSGENFAFEADILNVFALEGKGTDVQNVVNAEFMASVEGEAFATIRLIDYKNGSGGKIRLLPSDELMQQIVGVGLDMGIALEMVVDEDKAGNTLALNLLINEDLLLGISAEAKQTEPTSVQKPTNTIDAADENEVAEWISGFDYETILDNLGKAGVPEALLDVLEQLVGLIEANTSV